MNLPAHRRGMELKDPQKILSHTIKRKALVG